MKQIRQNTYVERELLRRCIEKRQRIIDKVKNGLASIAIVFCADVFLYALVLMS